MICSSPTYHLKMDIYIYSIFSLLPDAEGTGGADLQRKLDLLNGALDAERAEQARRQMQYIAHCKYSIFFYIVIGKILIIYLDKIISYSTTFTNILLVAF